MLSFLIATPLLLRVYSPSADESGVTESYLGTETTARSIQTIESTKVKEEQSSEVASSNQI